MDNHFTLRGCALLGSTLALTLVLGALINGAL